MARDVVDFTPGGVFQGTNINFTNNNTNNGGGGSTGDDKYVTGGTLNGSIVTFTYNDGESFNVDLSGLPGGGGSGTGDSIESFLLTGTDLVITEKSGLSFTVDLGGLIPSGPDSDTNTFLETVQKVDNSYLLTRNDGVDFTIDLSPYDEIDNQTGTQQSFTHGLINYIFSADGKLTITTSEPPPAEFDPSLSTPAPKNALDENSYTIDIGNLGDFELDEEASTVDVSVGTADIQDGMINIQSVPAGTEDVEVTANLVDTMGDTQTLTETIDQIIPYWEGTSAMGTTLVPSLGIALTQRNMNLTAGKITITPSAPNTEGRVRYWFMANKQYTVSQNGFEVSTTVTSGQVANITYYLHDVGVFGNPFDSSAPASAITFDIV